MKPAKRKLALLIGVSEYETDFSPIVTAQRDVEAIKQVLENPDIGEFTEIRCLINPDRQEMEESIETIFSSAEKDDLVLFYFSGHGIKDESGELYFTTRRTRKNPQGQGEIIKATAVDANLVKKNMNESPSKHQVIILDCCFSGAFARGLSVKDDEKVDVRGQLGGEEPSREGRAVLTSSTSMQPSFSYEGEELSIYTRYLVEGISTGAADIDCDDMISVDELHEYARRRVQEAAPAMKPEIYVARQGYKILLTKALVDDPRRRYRKEVEVHTLANHGKITAVGQRMLEYLRENLSLDIQEASAIEDEVLEPYKKYEQNLQRYEQACTEAAQQEYLLGENTLKELSYYQQMLRLRDEDVAPIRERVVQESKRTQSINKPIQFNTLTLGMTSFRQNWQNMPLFVKLLTLLLPVIAGGLVYFFWKNHSTLPSHSTPPEISSNPDFQQQFDLIEEVPDVPSGRFNYGGFISFAALTEHGMNDTIMQDHPEFQLRYTEPPDGKPGSGKGIEMLINGELSFAQSARPLEEADYSEAKLRGFSLEQVPVAIDGVVFYVHPELPVSGLSIDQLQAIFKGQITNWKQVGGPDLVIVPVALDVKATSALKLLLGDDSPGSNVEVVSNFTLAIREVAATLGAISYASAPIAAGQQTIRPIAIAKADTKEYIQPFIEDGQINSQAIRDGTYPLTRSSFIVIRRDGSIGERAGVAYTNMLLSREGQAIIEKSGFAPIRPIR